MDTQTETSLISRFVAILTPVFAIAAGWVAGEVAQAVPGAHLNQDQIVAFMGVAATAVIAAGWKWLHGWQQHEQRVAQGIANPVKPGPAIPGSQTRQDPGTVLPRQARRYAPYPSRPDIRLPD